MTHGLSPEFKKNKLKQCCMGRPYYLVAMLSFLLLINESDYNKNWISRLSTDKRKCFFMAVKAI